MRFTLDEIEEGPQRCEGVLGWSYPRCRAHSRWCYFGGGGSTTNATSNTVTQPSPEQAPYLAEAFQGADNLYQNYQPQYYPGMQIAPMTAAQQAGTQGTINQAQAGEPITGSTMNFDTALQGGGYFNAPNSGTLQGLQNPAALSSNPAFALSSGGTAQANSWLSNFLGQGGAASNPYLGALSGAGQGALTNPYSGALGKAGSQALTNPGTSYLTPIASGAATSSNPAASALQAQAGGGGAGSPTLANFANGAFLGAGNPYSQATLDSIKANVLPSIESTFVNNGSVNNPASAYAASQGLASALAPFEMQNYQQGLSQMQSAAEQQAQLQQGAAGTLGSQFLTGTGLQSQAGQNIAQNYLTGSGQNLSALGQNATNYLTGTGQNIGALGNAATNYLGGLNANVGAANSLASNANQGASVQGQNYLGGLSNILGAATQQGNQYQQTLGNMTQSLLTAPQIQQMPYYDSQQMYTAGAQQQAQQQAQTNANIQQWNYNQTLPYNLLSNFLGNVGGGMYGQQSASTTPYQNNTAANLLGLAGGGLSAYTALANMGLFSSAAAGAGSAAAAGGMTDAALAALAI